MIAATAPDPPASMITARRTMEQCFIASYDAYFEKKRHQETALTLKKASSTILKTRTTESSTDFADNEIPADKEQLEALIQRRCNETFQKKLQTELDKRLKIEGAKNFSRGKQSASRKKKTEQQTSRQQKNSQDGKSPGTNQDTKKKSTKNSWKQQRKTNNI